MIRLLTKYSAAHESRWRWLFHPDPELLPELARSLTAHPDEAAALATKFSRVVSSIRVGVIHKVTRPGRLRECDEVLAETLGPRGLTEVRLLDVGASDGTTTLDTVRYLRKRLALPIRATLLDRYVQLLRYERGRLVEYRSPDGSPVMLRLGPLGLQLSSVETTRDPLSRWLGRAYLRRSEQRSKLTPAASFDLVNPEVRRAGIEVFEANMLERQPALARAFDVIRASNILNRDYFVPAEIMIALVHLHAYLDPSGILVVSRNDVDDGVDERGSVWRRTATGFERLRDFGGGSYVGALVDELHVPATRA